MSRIILLFAGLLFSVRLLAVTYYVDGKTGSDSFSGLSKTKALKSLLKVNSLQLNPGDSVLFRASTQYHGQLKISCRGLRNKNIVYSLYGEGEKPQINAGGGFSEAVFIINSEYLRFHNFEITNRGDRPQALRKGLHIKLEDFGVAHNIHISDLYIHDVNGSNVKKEGGGAGIHFANGGKKIKSAFNGLLIEKCLIERTDRNGITGAGYWNRTEWFPSYNVVIRNNRLNDIGGDGIVPIGCEGALIEHNILYKVGQRFPEGDAAAGIWPWSCDNTIIQFNEVSHTAGPWDSQGFDSDWNCRNTLIQYNFSHDNQGGFLLVCNDGGVKLSNSVGNIGTTVRYNVSYNDGGRNTTSHAGFSPIIHIPGPVYNTRIYNNVIYIPKRNSTGIDSTIIAMDDWNGYADSTLVANNIFYVEGTADFQMGRSTGNFYQTNLYYGRYLNKPITDGEINADPKFKGIPEINIFGFDKLKCFMLQDSSPARRRGTAIIQSIIKDFFGNQLLPLQNPSIGIHQ